MRRVLLLPVGLLLVLAGSVWAQVTPTKVTPTNTAADSSAMAIRCVNTAGNAFEACGGAGGGGGTSSSFGAAFPALGTAAGFSDGTNMQAARLIDLDSGAGTEYGMIVNLRRIAAGGSVQLLGQTTMALSLPVTLASDQSVLLVSQSGAWTVTANQGTPTNWLVNLSQINGVTPLMGNGVTGTGSPRVTISSDNTAFTVNIGTLPNEGQQTAANSISVTPDTDNDSIGATAAAPPGEATFVGGLTSGATGGFLTGLTVCDSFVNVNVATATTTLLVTGVAGRHVRICALSLVAAGADNMALVSGTGATCGTGTTGMTGGTTAATGYNFAANGGIAQGSGMGEINRTNATGDSVCIVTSAAVQLSGRLSYAIY